MRRHLGLLLLLMSPWASGADSQLLTLDAAVEMALRGTPQIEAQNANLEAAQALAVSAARLPDPALVVGVENLPVNGPDAYSLTNDFMTMRKVGISQEFPRSEKRRLLKARADAQSELAGAQLVHTQLEISRETARAWIRRATADAALNDLRTLQADIELGATTARAAVAAGRASSAEALTAEAAVARLKNRILQLQGESRQAQAELTQWIGAEAGRPLAPMPALDHLPATTTPLLASIHQHAAILPFDAQLSAARTDVALARAERRPDWSAELAFAKRGPDFSDMVSLQFTIDLPLFAKQRQNPVIAARNAELKRLQAQREAEIRMHAAEVQQMLIAWEQLGQQLDDSERELLPLARERSAVSLAAYRSGRVELRMALDAFQDEVNLLVDLAALRKERGNAWAYLRYLEPQHVPAGRPAP